jgi:four helix bundle protein
LLKDLKIWWFGKSQKKTIATMYQVCKNLTFSKDFAIRDQIRRAAIFISSNMAEGFKRNEKKILRTFCP